MYRVGIIGCGKILERHVEAINENDNFTLVALCDSDQPKLGQLYSKYGIPITTIYKNMIKFHDINLVVVATPNSFHFEHAKYALENGCDVIVEKPVSLNPKHIDELCKIAEKNNQKAYAVLQVRLNPTVKIIKDLLNDNFLGNIRGVSLIQRWQRPFSYFSGWRSEPMVGGGTLYECGIHYLDVLCQLFGESNVISTKVYNTKHKHVEIEDTIYSLLDFGEFGGSIEVNVSSEPSNLECSISIIGEKGYIKIGGSALDKIEDSKFIDTKLDIKFNNIIKNMPDSIEVNSYGTHKGSCPNHPSLYGRLDEFELIESKAAISLIDKIYKKINIQYYGE